MYEETPTLNSGYDIQYLLSQFLTRTHRNHLPRDNVCLNRYEHSTERRESNHSRLKPVINKVQKELLNAKERHPMWASRI